MEWIKIDKEHLPKGEILAGNFESGTTGYESKLIGVLYINGAGNIACNGEYTVLHNCTHYVDINNYNPIDGLL